MCLCRVADRIRAGGRGVARVVFLARTAESKKWKNGYFKFKSNDFLQSKLFLKY